ncbi:MAG: hypothetical protein ACFNS5_10755, partial [Prevotella melaninogenica]
SLFEIFEQITQHILFLGPSPRKRMQFLAALESSKRELTEIPYLDSHVIDFCNLFSYRSNAIHTLLPS